MIPLSIFHLRVEFMDPSEWHHPWFSIWVCFTKVLASKMTEETDLLEKPISNIPKSDFFIVWIPGKLPQIYSNWFRMLDTFWKLMFGQFHGFELLISMKPRQSESPRYDQLWPSRGRTPSAISTSMECWDWDCKPWPWVTLADWKILGAGTLVLWYHLASSKHVQTWGWAKISNQGDRRFWSILIVESHPKMRATQCFSRYPYGSYGFIWAQPRINWITAFGQAQNLASSARCWSRTHRWNRASLLGAAELAEMCWDVSGGIHPMDSPA